MATEKRLIDANKLKEQIIKEIHYYWNNENGGYYLAEDVIPDIEDAPTVDAVEVVRCRECTNGYESSGSSTGMRCKKWGCYDSDCECRPSDFCSYGERRADGP